MGRIERQTRSFSFRVGTELNRTRTCRTRPTQRADGCLISSSSDRTRSSLPLHGMHHYLRYHPLPSRHRISRNREPWRKRDMKYGHKGTLAMPCYARLHRKMKISVKCRLSFSSVCTKNDNETVPINSLARQTFVKRSFDVEPLVVMMLYRHMLFWIISLCRSTFRSIQYTEDV